MILIQRDRVPAPQILRGPKSKGVLETAKARAFYEAERTQGDAGKAQLRKGRSGKGRSRKERSAKAFAFQCYRAPEVKQLLAELFHGKCAYCESYYAGTQPVDVEHWRPKGMVVEPEETLEPGYYWLAADWDNLLPSCIDCNRQRTQIVNPSREERLVGKGNRFPLEPGSVRARKPESELAERPLLLHPCRDLPEEHLEFQNEAVIRPRLDASGCPSAKGAASIEVYALNRSGLVQSRAELLLLMQQRMYTVERLLEVLESDPDEGICAIVEDLLWHELSALSRFRRSDQPYSQLARQTIAAFIGALTR